MKKEEIIKLYEHEIKKECIQELKNYFEEEAKMRQKKQTGFDVDGFDGFIRRVIKFEQEKFN